MTADRPDTRAMPNGDERTGEHWNARLLREQAERDRADHVQRGRPVAVSDRRDGPFIVAPREIGDPEGFLRVRRLGVRPPNGAGETFVVPRERVVPLLGVAGARALLLAEMRDALHSVGYAVAEPERVFGHKVLAIASSQEQADELLVDLADRAHLDPATLTTRPCCVVQFGAQGNQCPDAQDGVACSHSHRPLDVHPFLLMEMANADRLDLDAADRARAEAAHPAVARPEQVLDGRGLMRAAHRLAVRLGLHPGTVTEQAARLGELHPATPTGDILLITLDDLSRSE